MIKSLNWHRDNRLLLVRPSLSLKVKDIKTVVVNPKEVRIHFIVSGANQMIETKVFRINWKILR